MLRVIHEPKMPWNGESYVYLARLANGDIKIGTSCRPKSRMRSLRSVMGMTVTLIGTMPGSFERERYLHDVYDDERIHGEVFASSPRLEALIATLAEQVPA